MGQVAEGWGSFHGRPEKEFVVPAGHIRGYIPTDFESGFGPNRGGRNAEC